MKNERDEPIFRTARDSFQYSYFALRPHLYDTLTIIFKTFQNSVSQKIIYLVNFSEWNFYTLSLHSFTRVGGGKCIHVSLL